MNNWTVILFFNLVIVGAAFLDMIAMNSGLASNAAINEVMNTNALTLADVQLGSGNPIGSEFGGNILMTPTKFKAWTSSLSLNYSWLVESDFGVIRYIYMAFASSFAIFLGLKAAAAILNFLPFGGR